MVNGSGGEFVAMPTLNDSSSSILYNRIQRIRSGVTASDELINKYRESLICPKPSQPNHAKSFQTICSRVGNPQENSWVSHFCGFSWVSKSAGFCGFFCGI